MADNHFSATVEALFKGMDHFVTTKTVVGEAVKVDDAIILPLVDVTCGMAAGSFSENARQNGGGGMSAKMSPSAVLVIQNGVTKLVNVKNQDAVTKVLDMIPDFVNKFTNKGNKDEVSEDAIQAAEQMADTAQDESVQMVEP
ncbi:MAG: GerW family sporulation protein [Lachnospiraceae bacterium]